MNRCQSKYFRRKKSWRQLHFLLIKIFKSLHVPNAINDHQFNKWFEHSSKNTFMDRLVRSVETTSHIKICQTIILKHSLNCTKCFKIFIHKCVFKCHMKTSRKISSVNRLFMHFKITFPYGCKIAIVTWIGLYHYFFHQCYFFHNCVDLKLFNLLQWFNP